MFCVKCGSEVHGQFCTSCGTPMGAQTDETLSSAQTQLRPGPPTAMTGDAGPGTTVGAPPPRRGPGAGALIAGLAAVALVAGAAIAVAFIVRGSDSTPAAATPGGTVTVSTTPTAPVSKAPAAVTPRAVKPTVPPGKKVAYWTSSQGTTRCVYYPENKNGVPSANCWHQGLGIVYHLYPGSVEGENLAYVSYDRAASLRSQFNSAAGTRWRFNQSETFISPVTGAPQFQCTLYEDRGMVCTDLTSGHGFQLNQNTPSAW